MGWGPFRTGEDGGLVAYAWALLGTALALALAEILHPYAGLENVDLVFLTAVIAIAVRYGLGPSLLAAVASVLAYNFFFIPPFHTLEVADPKNLAALGFFLAFSVIVSNLAARIRAKALEARTQARRMKALYAFSRAVSGVFTVEGLASTAVAGMADLVRRDALLLLPNDTGVLQVQARSNPDDYIEDIEFAAIRASFSGGEWRGRAAMRLGPRLYYPITIAGEPGGLVALSREGGREPLSEEGGRLFASLCDQIGAALDRLHLAEERDRARMAAESERLRTALLSSLSHDLKTPLASITGAITALRQFPDLYDEAACNELAGTIQDEAERMTCFVTNLLDMTRLEAGGIALQLDPVDAGEVIGTALQRTAAALAGHKVQVAITPDLPMLTLDVVLFEQVLVNLLDNAAKYAPAGGTITVQGRFDDEAVKVAVMDEGPGLPPQDLERVFDKFYRSQHGDAQRAGTGLGLAICRGFVEAMGGTITAQNREDRSGAAFTVTFPKSCIAAIRDEAAE